MTCLPLMGGDVTSRRLPEDLSRGHGWFCGGRQSSRPNPVDWRDARVANRPASFNPYWTRLAASSWCGDDILSTESRLVEFSAAHGPRRCAIALSVAAAPGSRRE